ncbi:TonB-dependent receptor [Chitinophaga sp. ARDCPP14]|uniref:TonB-dependent receptor n=1 Tax=Chitinophaga sp. ARDCPP14 TaxID=3391139 RepID=UPI003F528AF6
MKFELLKFRAVLVALLLLIQILPSFYAKAQEGTNLVKGIVHGADNEPLAGVSVIIRNNKTNFTSGTKSDTAGVFTFSGVPAGGPYSFSVTMIGYESQKLSGYTLKGGATFSLVVDMKPSATGLGEVVVTGVFDKRKKMEASVAISTISAAQASKLALVSASDILKNVPGVYVNSSLGEVRNTVYSRGVSVGSNDGASGYYYVSMQEDGLPVSNITCSNFGPDYFLRADATVGRLEAVRGGTASILGANAPGGIFNYITKEGGDKTQGEVVAKYGLEGNGKNSFYRTDLNVGGPLGKNWFWNAGGFYRYAEGARYPGYPMNNGGQFRGNLVKKYSSGSLKFYAKYLNDHNGWFEFTPTLGFTNPKPAPGFSETSNVLMPSIQQNFSINQTGQNAIYNNKDLIHSTDKSAGFNWEQRFGDGWTFSNAMRYSDKSTIWNTNGSVYPIQLTDQAIYTRMNTIGQPGTYHIRDLKNGRDLATVETLDGRKFTVTQSNLPGGEVVPNSLFYEPLLFVSNKAKEYLDQFSLTKKMKNMSFTLGGFFGSTKLDRLNGRLGFALGTVEAQPQVVGITRTNPDGTTALVTNSNGVMTVNRVGQTINHVTQNQLALFFGHNWQITPALNLDWGVRYETVRVKGYNSPSVANQDTAGGVDKNKLTLYDNAYATTPSTFNFNNSLNTFSYSAGLNYKINNHFSVYGRYSQGNKAPDLDLYINATSDFLVKTLDPQAQKVSQFELGIKAKTGNLSLFVTPFYSVLSHVPNLQTFQNADQTNYNPLPVYNKYRTYGVEVEADYGFAKHFNIHGVITLQRSKALDFKTWLANNPGPQDDSLVTTFSGNETDNIARSMINITPSYNLDKFYAQFTWSYMGKRQANVANAFLLPSFSQFNFSAGYDISKSFRLSFIVNNIFNTYGVMSWSRPGSFNEALDRQGFTKQMYEDAVKSNRPYSTVAIAPRAYFMTAAFKF